MDGYGLTGFLFLFGTSGWLAYRLRHLYKLDKAHKVKKGLHDEQIKDVSLAFTLRDAALASLLYAISLFCFPIQGMSKVSVGSPEYAALTNVNDFAAGMIVAFSILTFVLQILKSEKWRQLNKTVHHDAATSVAGKRKSKKLFKSKTRS